MKESKVDLAKRMVHLDGKKYWYELDDDGDGEDEGRVWYTESKKFAIVRVGNYEDLDYQEVRASLEEIEEIENRGDGLLDWTPADARVKNTKKLKQLNRLVDRAAAEHREQEAKDQEREDAAQHREDDKEQNPGRPAQRAKKTKTSDLSDFEVMPLKNGGVRINFRGKVYVGRPMGTDNDGRKTDEYEFARVIDDGCGPEYIEAPEKMRKLLERVRRDLLGKRSESSKPGFKARSSETEGSREDKKKPKVKRTKYGIRILSNDGKHSFDIGVWKSRNYPGCTTIRLFVAGRHFLYTVDKIHMEALRREISRGEPT